MKYNAVKSIGLFKLFRQEDPEPPTENKVPLLPDQYPDAEACQPAPLFSPEGGNTYFGWKAYVARTNAQGQGEILLPSHLEVIRAIRAAGGVLSFGLQPDSGTIPRECHDAVINDPIRLRALFAALKAELAPGFTIIVRYASEMNQPGPDNPYAGDPASFKVAMVKVADARNLAGQGVLLAFSPAINAAVGKLGPSPAGTFKVTTIMEYWQGLDAIDVLSCTLYCRPQTGSYSDSPMVITQARTLVVQEVMSRANAYFRSPMKTGRKLMIDEMGGSMWPATQTDPSGPDAGKPARSPDNDGMLRLMLQKLLADPRRPNEYGTIDYTTLFLKSVWGRDAELRFISGNNP